MKICVILNPKAGSAEQSDLLRQQLAERRGVTILEPSNAAELRVAVADAARHFRRIVIAGGDGTIHSAVNALGPRFPRTRLAFIPLGTGNDLCRTLGIPLDPVKALSVLDMGRKRKIDVMRVEGGYSGFAVNAATGGLSGRVAADVTAEMKAFWGPFAYLRGAAGPFAERAAYRLCIRFDDGPPEVFEALNIVVANARTAAGGFTVAPTANLEDGLLDVVIVRAGDFLDLSVIAAHLMAGDYLADDNVLHRVARKVEIESDPPMLFSIDGEVAEGPRFAFSIVPRALRVLVGPTYHSDPTRNEGRSIRQRLFGLLAHVLHMVRSVPRAYALALLVAVAGGVAGWLMWK